MTPHQQIRAALRSDFLAFLRKCVVELHPGTPFLGNWHIEAMANCLERVHCGDIRRLIVAVPPRSLKSMAMSVAFPAFVLGHNPGARVICVSYGKDLAEKHARDTRDIMKMPWYRSLFPGTVITKSVESLIETSRGGSRLATSISGVLTGLGADYIIIDDPIKPGEIASATARDRVNRFFEETLLSRQESKATSRILVTMQRLHEDDLVGHLLRKENAAWHTLILPAIAPADVTIDLGITRAGEHRYQTVKAGEALHPEREPLRALEELKRDMGSAAFAAQYLQDPVPALGLMLKPQWVRRYPSVPPREAGRVTQSWDTAYKADTSHDYSVCTTWLEVDTNHYLLDCVRVKVDFPRLVNQVKHEVSKHRPDAVLVEDQGSGISLIQALKASSDARAIGIQTKDDKVTRFNRILPMFERGEVHLPADAPWMADLLHELHGFPNAKHDDQVDSVSQYLAWARDRGFDGFSYSFI